MTPAAQVSVMHTDEERPMAADLPAGLQPRPRRVRPGDIAAAAAAAAKEEAEAEPAAAKKQRGRPAGKRWQARAAPAWLSCSARL